jgi:hypothetical protein
MARLVSIACVSLLALAGLAASAEAKRPILRGITEDLHRSTNSAERKRWFDRTAEAGADVTSLALSWRGMTDRDSPPADPRNPADSAYSWSRIDAAVREARSRGMKVAVVVTGAPDWAEGPGRPGSVASGTWKPDPGALGAFAEALGRRYSGHYSEGGKRLPQVKYFEVWNEPNFVGFLTPQFEGGQTFAPDHYRRMLNAFYDGLQRSHPAGKVLGPGTLSFGQAPDSIRPLAFIREVLCLNDRNRAQPGCGPHARLDILSHHPINPTAGPREKTAIRDNITVSSMGRIIRALRAAERAGTVSPGGRHPVWASEIWWFTKPPTPDVGFRTSPRKQALYLEESLYLLWRQGVQAMIWWQLADDTGFPSGLFYPSGRKKPSYTAYRFPFVGDRRSKRRVTIWGIAPRSGKVSIQRKRGGGWRTVKSVRAKEGRPFGSRLRLTDSARLRAKIKRETSLVWRQRG